MRGGGGDHPFIDVVWFPGILIACVGLMIYGLGLSLVVVGGFLAGLWVGLLIGYTVIRLRERDARAPQQRHSEATRRPLSEDASTSEAAEVGR